MTTQCAWPFEQGRRNPLLRARQIAHMYRVALGDQNPQLRDQCDDTAVKFGETWAIDRSELYEDDDHLTGAQAADVLCVSEGAVRQYRLRGRLRGFQTPDGWRYQYSDVRSMSTVPMGRPSKTFNKDAA